MYYVQKQNVFAAFNDQKKTTNIQKNDYGFYCPLKCVCMCVPDKSLQQASKVEKMHD